MCCEVHGAANAIILEFHGRPVHCPQQPQQQQQQQQPQHDGDHPGQRLVHSPALASRAVRRSLRYLALGAARLAQLCQLFVAESSSGNLTKEEQREVKWGKI